MLCATFGLLPLLAHFAPTQLTLLLLVAAVALLALNPSAIVLLGADRWVAACLAAILALSLLSAFWAVDPGRALDRGVRLIFELAAGLFLAICAGRIAAADRRPGLVLLVGILAFGAIFALDALSGAAISRASRTILGLRAPPVAAELNQPETLLALLAWPAVVLLIARGYRLAALGLCAGVLFALAHSTGGVGLLAFAGGLAVAAIALAAPRLAAGLLAAALIASVTAGPWFLRGVDRVDTVTAELAATATAHPGASSPLYGAAHRLYIWHFAASRIAEHPLRGWGLEASRAMPGGKQTAAAAIGVADKPDMDPELKRYLAGGEIMPLHPHNASLQILMELGYPGGLAWLALGLLLLWRAAALPVPRAVAASVLGMLGTALAVLHFSYGIWQSWWLAALFLAASAMQAALAAAMRS
ncbi:MAG: O-antigen ligase family protein [Alphaproteobacteria bacterium]